MVSHIRDGLYEFKVFAPKARKVQILGTFTGWHGSPVTMIPGADGWWMAQVALGSGDHEFSYLVDKTCWLADYAAGGVRLDDYGNWVSLLSIQTEIGKVAA